MDMEGVGILTLAAQPCHHFLIIIYKIHTCLNIAKISCISMKFGVLLENVLLCVICLSHNTPTKYSKKKQTTKTTNYSWNSDTFFPYIFNYNELFSLWHCTPQSKSQSHSFGKKIVFHVENNYLPWEKHSNLNVRLCLLRLYLLSKVYTRKFFVS